MRAIPAFVSVLLLIAAGGPALGEDATVVHVPADDTKSVYWEINLTGVVWLSIRGPAGPGCADLYWRTYPLFLKVPLGEVCGNIRLDVPGLSKAAAAASLYAHATKGEVKIIGSSYERVAFDFPKVTFP